MYNTWSRAMACAPRLLSFFPVSRPRFGKVILPRALLLDRFQLLNGYTGRTCGRSYLAAPVELRAQLPLMFLDMLPCHCHVLTVDLSRRRTIEIIGIPQHCKVRRVCLLPPNPETLCSLAAKVSSDWRPRRWRLDDIVVSIGARSPSEVEPRHPLKAGIRTVSSPLRHATLLLRPALRSACPINGSLARR